VMLERETTIYEYLSKVDKKHRVNLAQTQLSSTYGGGKKGEGRGKEDDQHHWGLRAMSGHGAERRKRIKADSLLED